MKELISIVVFGFDPIMVIIAITLAFFLRRVRYLAVLIVPSLVILASYLITKGLGVLPPPAHIQLLKAIGIIWSSALITFLVVYLSLKRAKRKEKEIIVNR